MPLAGRAAAGQQDQGPAWPDRLGRLTRLVDDEAGATVRVVEDPVGEQATFRVDGGAVDGLRPLDAAHRARLRRKLDGSGVDIHTVRGVGYRLDGTEAS